MLFGRRMLLCIFTVLGLAFCVGSALGQTSFNTVVVFGDSLSDTGNIANLTQNQFGIRYPADNKVLGLDFTDGRFTDGKDTQPAAQAYFGLWIEQLAASFPAHPAVKDSLDGGTNYAYGDATTGSGTTTESKTFGGVPFSITLNNMGDQVSTYLATNPTPNATTLYALWGGSNDLLNAALAGTDPVAAAATAVQNEVGLIQQLIAAGARNFVVPNLPPLGGIPLYAGTSTSTALNNASGYFAQALAQGISQAKLSAAAQGITITVYQPDILTLFATVVANPSASGLSNFTAAAQNITGNPDTYLIWDGEHPTTTGHHLVAALAASLIAPLAASTTTLTAPAVLTGGQTVTLTATVTSTASKTIPTGLVAFLNGTTVIASAALDSTGTATATIPTPTGTAAFNISAVYAGDTTFQSSTAAAQPLTILTTPVNTAITLTSSDQNAIPGESVVLTATVTANPNIYGIPSGTVSFLQSGTTLLGTAPLVNGVATFTSTTLPQGNYGITASYAANGLFGASATSLGQDVNAPGFTPSAAPTTLTLSSGASGTVNLIAASLGRFSGALTLSCGTLPAHFTCTFSSPTITVASGAQSSVVTLTIATNGSGGSASSAAFRSGARPGSWSAPKVFSATLLFPGLAGLLFLNRRRRGSLLGSLQTGVLLLLLGAGAVFGFSGCGSSSNAPTGSYTVPVTFTPAASSGVAPMTLSVPVLIQ